MERLDFLHSVSRLATVKDILACVLAVLIATSCAPVPVVQPTQRAVTTATREGPKVIPFFTTESDPEQIALLQELITEYQRLNPNVEVDIVIASPTSRGRRLLTALASGADLGIFEIEPTLMLNWVNAGYVLPLDDLVRDIGESDFAEGSLFRHNGHAYALPYAVSVYGLWVRTDLLQAAGLPVPQSYAEVLTAAKRLTRGGVYGIALPGGQNIATLNYFSIFLWQNGGDYFSCDGKIEFDKPAALEAIQRWKAMSQYAPPSFTTWDYREQIDAYLKGQVAMTIYAGRLGVQLEETNPKLADRTTVVFPPWGPVKVTLGVWSRFAIAAGTRYQKEAKDFLRWLASGERLRRYDMALPGHMIPPLRSVRAMPLDSTSRYVQRHRDWVQAFYDWIPFTNHPAMNMGSVRNGRFERAESVPPWAQEIFGTPGIIDTMLQEISLKGRGTEEAWQDAVRKMEQSTRAWQTSHPSWTPAKCATP
ncbi:MAG: sugar ABC transporter substrate-binding protein [Chloroflexi bacterium]|nr:sugar ABC transporter substrate-binding protein [Chloroflexota bacterium]